MAAHMMTYSCMFTAGFSPYHIFFLCFILCHKFKFLINFSGSLFGKWCAKNENCQGDIMKKLKNPLHHVTSSNNSGSKASTTHIRLLL